MCGLQKRWYADRFSPALFLWVLPTCLFAAVSFFRRLFYRYGWLKSYRLPVPVVIVGNLVAGGAGKTPLTIFIAKALSHAGFHPGIVSRGYGGAASRHNPIPVYPDSDPDLTGEEPILLAMSLCPVWAGRDRVAAARALLKAHPLTDVLICDDGLQHYRLKRDVEIVVFDTRYAGNGFLLPMGPLREPLKRMRQSQALVFNGASDTPEQKLRRDSLVKIAPNLPFFDMGIAPPTGTQTVFYRLGYPETRCAASSLIGKNLRAIAGIGHPERFFATLAHLGLEFTPHPFPDHHRYTEADLRFPEGETLLMTEKDGVKCARLPLDFAAREIWVLPVAAQLSSQLIELLLEHLHGRKAA